MRGGGMAGTTRRIVLTFDHFSDYFPSDDAESQVRGLTAREGGPAPGC